MADKPLYYEKTPCIGLCSTVYGDQVCRGCKRFSHEIVAWNRYDVAARKAVWQRLEQLLDQVVWARLELVSTLELDQALECSRVAVDAAMPLGVKVQRWLARAGDLPLQTAGLRLRDRWEGLSTRQLRDEIDQTFLVLSQAYSARRMPPVA